jgi:endonuclease/exonuclease/phosphatase family metal-dependent hydrolase
MMPGTNYPRIFTWGRFRSLASGQVFYVYSAHVDHQSHEARLAAAEQITQHMEGLERELPPALLVGDLNHPPGTPEIEAYKRILGRACGDEWTAQGLDKQYPPEKIDYIMHTPHWRPAGCRVLRPWGAGGERFSDHEPVVARLELVG